MGPEVLQIWKPESAQELLDLAIGEHGRQRRVIFFCSCGSPAICHRNEVRRLVLKVARARRTRICIAEWPGGEPVRDRVSELTVEPSAFSKVMRGGMRIAIDESLALGACCALPWGSLVELNDGERELIVPVGPAHFSAGRWFLPLFPVDYETEDLRCAVVEARESCNYRVFDTSA